MCHFSVREFQYYDALLFYNFPPDSVLLPLTLPIMHAPIQLNHQFGFVAVKVGNVSPKVVLAAKLSAR